MAQNYKVKEVQEQDTPFVDKHGNTWLTVAFEGVSEPVRWVVKDPSKVTEGMSVEGDIVEATSKAGKTYLRFKRVQQQPGNGKAPADPRTMYTAYAKDVWIALVGPNGQVNNQEYLDALDQIKSGGERLMNGDKE